MAVAVAPDLREVVEAKPFLKWVGGKRQLLPQLVEHAPNADAIGTYYEPFLGGGALFFHLLPARAVLSDSNDRLIRTYRGIRDDAEGVIDRLKSYRHHHDKHFFLKMRSLDVDAQTDAGVAAWFIYLNRTAYNGLYRVNSRNLFNVPFGDYKSPLICDEDNLRACAQALKGAERIEVRDFEDVVKGAGPGDFVYFDPPYAPLTPTSNFTDYTSAGFNDADQLRLRDLALSLKQKGVRVLVSNSSAARVSRWYKDFEHMFVRARRSVNCKPGSRGPVKELILF